MVDHPIIGHVHLKVSDLERSVAFYRDALGLELQQRYGTDAAFLSYGGYHHHVGLNVWMSKGAPPPPARAPGLFHFAILYPSRKDLALALQGLLERDVAIDGASDHGVSEAIYLRDPDGNGIELYVDRPREQWPMRDGQVEMVTEPLDLKDLLSEL
jgi:catechol 2,3-dioxygenase